MSHDVWAHADAAYVMGALEPEERAAYEEHLAGCAGCRAQVASARTAVGLLAGGDLDVPPLPATLLPSLVREARRARRRRRLVTGGLAAAAAASILAVLVTATPLADRPERMSMQAVGHPAITAEAAVEATPWGTRITLTCRYAGGAVAPGYRYALQVRATDGTTTSLGSWRLEDRSITFSGGTALRPEQIAAVEVVDARGARLLTLAGPGA